MSEAVGLIAGSGRLPVLFAEAARAKGFTVHAVALRGEADPQLGAVVASISWARVGQAAKIRSLLRSKGVAKVAMAGGIDRVRSLRQAWPDAGMLEVIGSLRSLRDDALLRALAAYFEAGGVRVVAPTELVPEVLAREGRLAGPPLTFEQEKDVALGREVAQALGRADVGQTVVVKGGVVLAVEAVEGTDEAIRRAGRYGGDGAVVVKRVKPNQDLRFDLPAVGPVTLEVMREVGAKVLAIDAGHSVILDGEALFHWADRLGISVVGVRVE